jgi:hypothetical protein
VNQGLPAYEPRPDEPPNTLGLPHPEAVAVENWRASLRQEAVGWLAERFPGSFHRLAPGQLPTIEFLLTNQLRPWERDASAQANLRPGQHHWKRSLDLDNGSRYWQCTDIPSLRLQERYDSRLGLGQRNRLVLAAIEQEFTADRVYSDFLADPAQHGAFKVEVQFLFTRPLYELLVRWSLTALIRDLEEQLARIQDAADRVGRKRSSKALKDTQRQLLQTGIDSRIVVNDIVRYAQDQPLRPERRYVLNFTEVAELTWGDIASGESIPQGEAPPTDSLVEFLSKGQITDGERVSQLETDLREILSTSAELISASENLRLQRWVVWLTVIATIVAVIAAAAAVIALTRS